MTHPTLRTMAAVGVPHRLDPDKTAVLAIDFQNEYFSGRLPIPDGARALANAARLIAHADEAGMPVYHVQHVAPAGSPIFAADSESSAFHAQLQPAAHHNVVRKSSVSVFPTTDIDARLKKSGIDTLIVTGLMTHTCVAGAARDAVPLGYKVIVASDACATRDIDTGDGETVPHQSLHRAALTSIDDTFGDIMTTQQILGLGLSR